MVESSGPVTPSVNVQPVAQAVSSQGSSGMELLAIKATFSSGGELDGLLTPSELNTLSAELASLSQVIQSSPTEDAALSAALSQLYTEVENLTLSSSNSDVKTVLTQAQALSDFNTTMTAFTANPTPASLEVLLETVSNFPPSVSQTTSYQQIATAFAALSPDLQASMMQDITKKNQSDIIPSVKKYGGFLLSGFGGSLVAETGNNMLSYLLMKFNVTISNSTTVASLKQAIQQYSGLSLSDDQVEDYLNNTLFQNNLAAYEQNPSVTTFIAAYNSYLSLPTDTQQAVENTFYAAVSGSSQDTRYRAAEMSLIAFHINPTLSNLEGLIYSDGGLFQEPDDISLSQVIFTAFYRLPLDQQTSLMNSIVSDTSKTPTVKLQEFGVFLGSSISNQTIEQAYLQIIYNAAPYFEIKFTDVDINSSTSLSQLQTALNKMLTTLNLAPLTDTQFSDFTSYIVTQNCNAAAAAFNSKPSLNSFIALATAISDLPASQQAGFYQSVADQLSALGQAKPPTVFKSIMDGLNAQKATSKLSDTTKGAIKSIIQFAKVNKADGAFEASPSQETLTSALTAISKLPVASQTDKYNELESQFSSLPASTQASLVSDIATFFGDSTTTNADKAVYYPMTSFIYQSYMVANFTSNPSVQTLFDASNWVSLLDPATQDAAYQTIATDFLMLPTATQATITASIQAGLVDGSITQAAIDGFNKALAAMAPSDTELSDLLNQLTSEETQIFNEYQKELTAGTFSIQASNFSAIDQLNKIAQSLGYSTPLTTDQINDLMPYVTDATQKQLQSMAASIQTQDQQSSAIASLAGVSILYAIAAAMVGLLKDEQDKLDQDNALFVVAQDKVTAMNNVSNYYLTDIEAGKSISPEKFQLSIIAAYNPDALDGINANLANLSPPEGVGDIINKIQDGIPLSADENTILDQGYQAVLSSNSSIASDWADAIDVTTVQSGKPDLKFDTSTWTYDTGTTPPTLTSPTSLATTFNNISTDITTNITSVSNIITQQLQAQISEDTQELNTVITTANTLIQQYGQSLLTDAQNIK